MNFLVICLSLLVILSNHSVLAEYDAFPESEGPFESLGNSMKTNWIGETFETYNNREIVECSFAKQARDHLDVTSGCLKAKSAQSGEIKGWTADDVFRMVTRSRTADGKIIKWTNQTMAYRAFIRNNRWSKDGPILAYSGLHVFFRYQTSDNLYVASARYDGKVTIKEKVGGVYLTLAVGDLPGHYLNKRTGQFFTGQWVKLQATAVGNLLTFSINDEEVLIATSDSLAWGTTGIRTDDAEAYLDDIQMGNYY